MILDTSAIVAIFFREAERVEFLHKLRSAPTVAVGAPTLVETALVLSGRLREPRTKQLILLLERANAVVIPFDSVHWQAAVDAWLRFGRGRHPAQLNFGDCLAYATARVAGRPLLCKGDDFAKTDLVLA